MGARAGIRAATPAFRGREPWDEISLGEVRAAHDATPVTYITTWGTRADLSRSEQRRLALHHPRPTDPGAVAGRGGRARPRVPGQRGPEGGRAAGPRQPAACGVDRGELSTLRHPLGGADRRGELRYRPRDPQVRPRAGEPVRHLRGVLDPGVHPEPRDPLVEPGGRGIRAAAVQDVLSPAARAGPDRRAGRRGRGGRQDARREVRRPGREGHRDGSPPRSARRLPGLQGLRGRRSLARRHARGGRRGPRRAVLARRGGRPAAREAHAGRSEPGPEGAVHRGDPDDGGSRGGALPRRGIGRRLGVSRERARQLEARAKKKLRDRLQPLAA